jgi:RNA polymerase sigma-70 factor (ECF subfamily)
MLLRRGGSAVLGEALEDRVDALAGDLAESTQVRMDLEAAVAALGPPGGPEREVWQLLYVEDRSVDEVASITGVQPGTVKSRSFRARRLLRAALRAGGAREEGPS